MREMIRALYLSERDGILWFPGPEIQTFIHDEMLIMAFESDESRRIVVQALVDELNDDQAFSEARLFAAAVLGELNATEALDALVQNIDLRGILTSISINLHPVLNIVVDMGHDAVPHLERALHHHHRTTVREEAAAALGSIGGPDATLALRQALTTESNDGVRAVIRGALSRIALERRRHRK